MPAPPAKRMRLDAPNSWSNEQHRYDPQAHQINTIIPARSPWPSVNSPVPSSPAPVPGAATSMNNGTRQNATPLNALPRQASQLAQVNAPQNSTPHDGRMQSATWATVNNQVSNPDQQPPAQAKPAETNGRASRSSFSQEQPGRQDALAKDPPSSPLIDNLPKHKQRQIYGIISGIQGSIEHLTRELNSLKKSLGIDDDES